MGYRVYIAEMPKREYNKIKSMTREQLIEYKKVTLDEDEIEEGYLGIGVYDFGKDLHNLGKYNDFDPPKKSMSTFFKKKDLNKYFTEENDFCVIKPEFLEYVIEHYAQKVKSFYLDMIMPFCEVNDENSIEKHKPFLNSVKTEYNFPDNKHTFDFSKITDEEQTALFKIIEHIRGMSNEWGVNTFNSNHRPYRLVQNSNSASTSWKYEYAIFELVKIYNTFDWKKNIMFYYGY